MKLATKRIVAGPAQFNTVIDARSALVSALTMIVILALGVAALALGDFPVSVADVVGAFTGQTQGIERVVVLEWRLPRAFGAVAFGAALAVAGAIFQTITRNPLASPDIIGLAAAAFRASGSSWWALACQRCWLR